MCNKKIRKIKDFSLWSTLCSSTNKKLLSLILIIITVIYSFMPRIFADDIEENDALDSTVKEQIVESKQANSNLSDLPSINSRAAIVIDRNSNQILYGKNENEKRKMASTTKIMTSLVIIENCNLAETVEISKKAAGTGGSTLGIKASDKMTVKDLLYGLMLCSRK